MTGPNQFKFLGLESCCEKGADWNTRERAALWNYNLHYFDDLNAEAAELRCDWHRTLIARWIEENPAGEGVGWDPYPTSRRLVNWIKWSRAVREVPLGFDDSLAVQARWLSRRIEFHLLGNHLFANAKALVFAGLHFSGPEGDRFLATGLGILESQLREQVLPDGGHFERSTMYHAATLEDLLDLVNIMQSAGRLVPVEWIEAAARMQRWLEVMVHPDGGISFFNDAAFGVSPPADQLRAYADRLGHRPPDTRAAALELLADTGFARLSCAGACVIADVGSIGPDYLPAHAHAGTLSFELSIGGQRVLVNSGTSEYGISRERSRQRSTAAHNTVLVDEKDSSEVWAGFRVARRANARRLSASAGSLVDLSAEHDGYRRLRGRNLHRRRWTLSAGELLIGDEITGPFQRAEAFLHIHPDVGVVEVSSGCFELRMPRGGVAMLRFDGAAAVLLQPCTWHPYFGSVVPNYRIVARFSRGTLRTRLAFS